jgi:hypothetical protein
MRANEFITEQPVTTTNAQGVTTTVNKAANRVTQQSDAGTTVKDRTGGVRSIATPKVGGFQAKQTFRPDATPGYQQATYKAGGTTLDMKGSPETGYTKTVGQSVGGLDAKVTQNYSGQKKMDVSYNMGTTVGASQITDPRTGSTATTQTVTTAPSPTKRIQTTATKPQTAELSHLQMHDSHKVSLRMCKQQFVSMLLNVFHLQSACSVQAVQHLQSFIVKCASAQTN